MVSGSPRRAALGHLDRVDVADQVATLVSGVASFSPYRSLAVLPATGR
jgi:hypothetical protein